MKLTVEADAIGNCFKSFQIFHFIFVICFLMYIESLYHYLHSLYPYHVSEAPCIESLYLFNKLCESVDYLIMSLYPFIEYGPCNTFLGPVPLYLYQYTD